MSSVIGRLGLIADVQYVDKEDGFDFTGKQRRRYRNSLKILGKAVDHWNKVGVNSIIQLGDLIDVKARDSDTSRSDLDTVLEEFNRAECKHVVHLIGNHELYNFKRDMLGNLFDMKTNPTWYSFKPISESRLRLIVLDSYDLSTIEGSSPSMTQAALDYLSKHNPNDITRFGGDWSKGLTGYDKRFMPYNGGLGTDQLAWLDSCLAQCETTGDQCLILSHVPLCPDGCDPICLLWNYQTVLDLISSRPGTVLAVLAGHDHEGGYRLLEGVHHITFPSPLLSEGEEDLAFGVMEVFKDRLEFRGMGKKMVDHLVIPLKELS